jgi:hypothetical protein
MKIFIAKFSPGPASYPIDIGGDFVGGDAEGA